MAHLVGRGSESLFTRRYDAAIRQGHECRGRHHHGRNYCRRKKKPIRRKSATGSFQNQPPAACVERTTGGGGGPVPSQSCGPMRPGPRAAQAIRPPRHSLALGRLHDRVRSLMWFRPGANPLLQGFGPVPPNRGRISAFTWERRRYVSAHHSGWLYIPEAQCVRVSVCTLLPASESRLECC